MYCGEKFLFCKWRYKDKWNKNYANVNPSTTHGKDCYHIECVLPLHVFHDMGSKPQTEIFMASKWRNKLV